MTFTEAVALSMNEPGTVIYPNADPTALMAMDGAVLPVLRDVRCDKDGRFYNPRGMSGSFLPGGVDTGLPAFVKPEWADGEWYIAFSPIRGNAVEEDEYPEGICPGCDADVEVYWNYCPHCGDEL